MLKRLKRNVPRPTMLWLSRADVERVRNRLLTLYLEPGKALAVAPPDGFFGTSEIRVTGGVSPMFHYIADGVKITAWLKIRKNANPYWDVAFEFSDGKEQGGSREFYGMPVLARLIKAYAKHFPFVPTDNYFQKNGEFVA